MTTSTVTYQGIVTGGVIVLQDGQTLQEGTHVLVYPNPPAPARFTDLESFGMWKDRPDVTDPAAASLEWRRQIECRSQDE